MDVWVLVLTAIAAAASSSTVLLWFIDRRRRINETPEPAVHIKFAGWHEPWHRADREYTRAIITNSGDAPARHFEVTVSGALQLEHHHEDAKMAALMPGEVLTIPLSRPRHGAGSGEILWVWGSGRSIKVDRMRFDVSSKAE